MDTEDVDVLHLEAGLLDLVDDPPERAGGVGAGEDVLVHEESPDEVFVLPVLSDAGDLQDEGALVVEEVVDLLEEGAVAPDTNVLRKNNSCSICFRVAYS